MNDHIQISDVTPRIQYAADGSQTQFSYPFPIFVEDDLEVYAGDIKETSGYTVLGAGTSYGGTVTFDTPPASGVVVTLRRSLAIERTTDFQQSGAFRAKVINDELDHLTAALQQVADDVGRAVRLSSTDADADLELPSKDERANKVLGFDASGDAIATSGGGGTGGGVTDHGQLIGLSDDDHDQYHNDARADARYYTQAQIDAALGGKSNTTHNHDSAYVAISHVNDTSNPHGVTKSHVGLDNVENTKTNLSASVDPAQNDDGNDGYTVGSRWINVASNREFVCLEATPGAAVWVETTQTGGGGVSDHGSLTGLGDDDHTQYHNDARADARYYTQAAADAAFDPAGTGASEAASAVGTHESAYNHALIATALQAGTKLDDLSAPDDNTDSDATTSAHGLMPKADKTKLDGIASGAEVNAVDSVHGRTGTVAAVSGDYAASEVTNDSSVAGADVGAALDTLEAAIAISGIARVATDEHPVTAARNLTTEAYNATPHKGGGTVWHVQEPPYAFAPVAFDGASYLSFAGNRGAPDAKTVTCNAFIKVTSLPNTRHVIIESDGKFLFRVNDDGRVRVVGRNSTSTIILDVYSVAALLLDVWYDITFSADLAAGVAHMYVNGREDADTPVVMTDDTIDFGGAAVWGVGWDTDATPGDFFFGEIDRAWVSNEYVDLGVAANRERFFAYNNPVDLGSLGQRPTGNTPFLYVKGPAADMPTCLAGRGDFTETGTLTNGATITPTGLFQASGRTIHGPNGRPTPLHGWRIDWNDVSEKNTGGIPESFFAGLKAQGLPGNCIQVEFMWSSANGPSERYPSQIGVYQTDELIPLKNTLRNAARQGYYLVLSPRVSQGEAEVIPNLADDMDGSTGNPFEGWANHVKTITNATVTTGGSDYGNYRDRFFAWLNWIVPKLMDDPEIGGAVALIEMWHLPFHKPDVEFTDANIDLYLDKTPGSGFASLLLAQWRALVPNHLLGFSFRSSKILTRAIATGWTPLSDANICYITGGYGKHDVIQVYPPSTGKIWPDDSSQPRWNVADAEFEIVTFGAAHSVAWVSCEGPGLNESLRVVPLGADQEAFLTGLFNLYNQHTNGFGFHALNVSQDPQPGMAAGTEFGDLLRASMLGAAPAAVSGDAPHGEALVEHEYLASDTLKIVDGGQHYLAGNHAAGLTLTVPTHASVPYPIGHMIFLHQKGTGQITIAGASGVVVNTTGTLKTKAQHAWAVLIQVSTDVWVLTGDREAA